MAEHGHLPGGKGGRIGILVSYGLKTTISKSYLQFVKHGYPHVVKAIREKLEALRDGAAPVSLVTVRGIFVATILNLAPRDIRHHLQGWLQISMLRDLPSQMAA